MHGKEQVIAPILRQELGMEVVTPSDINTDVFGTFTREIERQGSQLQAARLKIQLIVQKTGALLALSSEGSFGPHPDSPFLPCNREIVVLQDQTYSLELVGEAFSTQTNFRHAWIRDWQEAQLFADQSGFPQHGLVVHLASNHLLKGIQSLEQLEEAVRDGLQRSFEGKVLIETDMRAMMNPTRMQVIAEATRDLVRKIKRACPRCAWPGFAPVDYRRGLPCALCHLPTLQVRSVLLRCNRCDFAQEDHFPEGMEAADPAECSFCNP
jgi:hypothetical protein